MRILTLACIAALGLSAARIQQTTPLVGVIGNWATVDDGGPALKIDGASWSGRTERAHLDAMTRTLFGGVSDTFAVIAAGAQAFPLAVARDVNNFTSGTLRVRFKMLGGASDQNAGIVFGLKRTGDYYFIRYNTKDGNVAVWKYTNGERAVVKHGEAHENLAMNQWHDLVVTIAGNKATGSVNGKLTVEHTFDASVSGRVGLWTKRDAITTFRDFSSSAAASSR